MDSGNSGSMQSSSGGDEEYDSRSESITAFLNPSGHFGPFSNPQPPPLPHNQHHQPSLFDPPSNYLEAFSQSPANPSANTLFNLDVVNWSRSLRSDPNCTDLGNLTGSSSSSSLSLSSSSSQSILGAQGPSQGPFPSSSSMPLRSVHDNGARPSPHSDQTNIVRNSKKRTRASRRAPTTVLTTDTSNFRAMVQEFTGIPAPPFSAASPYSRRLDLFGPGSAMKSGHLETLGPLYPLRPSAQKVQPYPFVSSSLSPSFLNSNVVDAIAPTNIASTRNNTITTSLAATTNTTNNYQLPSDLGLPRPPQNMLNMQNPMLTFQSILQSPLPPSLKYPLANVPAFSAKSQGSVSIPSFEELGMSHDHVNANLSGFSSHVASAGMPLRSDNNLTSWRDGVQLNDGNQDHLRSFNGNYGNSQRVSSCKLNCSASSSDFHPEKGSENVPPRGEGPVDSWICSSD